MPSEFNLSERRPAADGPIQSTLASDPDMVDLIAMFVEELPKRTSQLEDLVNKGELAQLKRMAHQLKGACGGYGFPDVGRAAASLEELLLAVSPDTREEELKRVRLQVDELVGLCRRVSNG